MTSTESQQQNSPPSTVSPSVPTRLRAEEWIPLQEPLAGLHSGSPKMAEYYELLFGAQTQTIVRDSPP